VLKREWLSLITVAIVASVASFFGARAFFSQQLSNQQAQISALQDELFNMAMASAATATIPPSQWRRLSDDERVSLLAAFKAHRSELQDIVIYAMADSEPRQYAMQFVDLFREARITNHPRQIPLTTTVDVGLIVGLVHSDEPSEAAQTLMNILRAAGLVVQYSTWRPTNPLDANRTYCLFIGPRRWNGPPSADD
jgi:hypothetical protein